jgi:hypothetical protein
MRITQTSGKTAKRITGRLKSDPTGLTGKKSLSMGRIALDPHSTVVMIMESIKMEKTAKLTEKRLIICLFPLT